MHSQGFCEGQLIKSSKAIDCAAAANDITNLHKEAHALKTAAGFMGAMRLSRVCAELQVMCSVDGVVRNEDSAGLEELMEKYRTELKSVWDFMDAKAHSAGTMGKPGGGTASSAVLSAPTADKPHSLAPLPMVAPVVNLQAAQHAEFESWVVGSRLGPIRDQLIELGVEDVSDLAELDLSDLRELRSQLKKVAQRKFDKDAQRLGIPLDALQETPKSARDRLRDRNAAAAADEAMV